MPRNTTTQALNSRNLNSPLNSQQSLTVRKKDHEATHSADVRMRDARI
jgi:hypothetical protein